MADEPVADHHASVAVSVNSAASHCECRPRSALAGGAAPDKLGRAQPVVKASRRSRSARYALAFPSSRTALSALGLKGHVGKTEPRLPGELSPRRA